MAPSSAEAQEPFLGEIRIFGYNFCPRGWADANGQLLSISQNTALFSLYGTMYGGDGRTTFGLPDLRGRTAVHVSNVRGRGAVQGSRVGGERVVTGEGTQTMGGQVLRYCVATAGIFPSRS